MKICSITNKILAFCGIFVGFLTNCSQFYEQIFRSKTIETAKKGPNFAEKRLKIGLETRFSGVTRGAGTAFQLRSGHFLGNFFERIANYLFVILRTNFMFYSSRTNLRASMQPPDSL